MARMDIMKPRAKDHTEDTYYQIEDKVSENAEKISGKMKLADKGNIEKTNGKVQEKMGKAKKVLEK